MNDLSSIKKDPSKYFDWRLSVCPIHGRSVGRAVTKIGESFLVTCPACLNLIGWLPFDMPLDYAQNLPCPLGYEKGKRLGECKPNTIDWLSGQTVSEVYRIALKTLLEERK